VNSGDEAGKYACCVLEQDTQKFQWYAYTVTERDNNCSTVM